jgi:hypothetical protein
VYAAIAVAGLVINRRHVLPTLRAPFTRTELADDDSRLAEPGELESIRG